MATFTDNELEYLRSQRLGRLATADSNNSPHVVPVGFRVADDGTAIDIGGGNLAESKKYRDLQANPKVAIVIDDLAGVDPWTPRGLEVRGIAELHDAGGPEKFGEGWGKAWIRIVPERVMSWGIEGHAFSGAGQRRSRTIPRSPEQRGRAEGSVTPSLVELAQLSVDATNTGDFDALMGLYSTDAVWDSGGSDLAAERFEGSAAIRSFFEEWFGALEDMEVRVEEIHDAGNGVVFSHLVQRGRPRGSSAFVDFRFATVSIWAEGLIRRNEVYTDIEEARVAASRCARERRIDAVTANVQLIERALAEFGQTGAPWALDPNIDWYLDTDLPDQRVLHGAGDVAGYFREFSSSFEEIRLEIGDCFERRDYVVASFVAYGRPRGSTSEVRLTETWTFKLRDGLIVEVREYPTKDAALVAIAQKE
jgi:pyridoxamine 5'-phosphate oxidase family protein